MAKSVFKRVNGGTYRTLDDQYQIQNVGAICWSVLENNGEEDWDIDSNRSIYFQSQKAAKDYVLYHYGLPRPPSLGSHCLTRRSAVRDY